jgi:hypothetical protein
MLKMSILTAAALAAIVTAPVAEARQSRPQLVQNGLQRPAHTAGAVLGAPKAHPVVIKKGDRIRIYGL